jgi:2-C-methyl-D-erythritol 4-phosphate cytidylyltransferase
MSPSSPAGSRPEVGVLLPAAGQGERAGAGELKQFRPIGGVPMLLRAVRPFAQHPLVRQIVIALPAAFASRPPDWLHDLMGQRLQVVAGGATRADSVALALERLDPACGVVLVHDAARPFVGEDTIDAVIAAAQSGCGAVAAVSVGDTLKRVADTPNAARPTAGPPDRLLVRETLDRRGVWRAQTPQGFPRAWLEEACARRGGAEDVTDDAQMVERLGRAVVVIPDHTTNIKVTTADDFILAEALASR